MAEWRLFTARDLDAFGIGRSGPCPRVVSLGDLSDAELEDRPSGVWATRPQFAAAIDRLRYQILRAGNRIQFEHGTEGKIPRAHVPRPYRLTERGVLLAATIVKHSQAYNFCEVDVFLAAEVPELEPLAAVRATLLFLFSDAVKCGGSMAVQFSPTCLGGMVPEAARRLARAKGIELARADQGCIQPDEARALYLALTPISRDARAVVRSLAERGVLSVERVCYLIHHGVWTAEEVAGLLLCCPAPERVLGGELEPGERQLQGQALFHARAAILGATLGRVLACRDQPHPSDSSLVHQPEGDEPSVTAAFLPKRLIRRYTAGSDELRVDGWDLRGEPLVIPPGSALFAALRPRGRAELAARLGDDLRAAASVDPRQGTRAVVVPFDALTLGTEERRAFEHQALELGARILVCPLKVSALDAEAQRRFQLGGYVRL